MSDPTITQLLKQEASGPPFNKIMSKDARKLRDEVYNLVFSNAYPKNFSEKGPWLQRLKDEYDPINFERAVIFDHYDRIREAVTKRTSNQYKKDTEAEKAGVSSKLDHEKGTRDKRVARIKGLDWLDIAKFENWEKWWYKTSGPTKSNPSIEPSAFDRMIPQFRPMYELFVGWMYVDFNRSSLFHIIKFANTYSLDFVQECMAKIEDPRKHETAYLDAVIEKEYAIMRSELDESNDLNEFSKNVIDSIVDFADKHEPVNWDKLRKDTEEHIASREILSKVKLS